MNLIPSDKLIIPDNRQRRSFDEESIEALANSIQSKGLLHPIVVRRDETTDGYVLVAGERRFRAMQLLGWSEFPVTFITDLEPLELREAELEENILRQDLTWQEEARARAELHDLRLAQTEGAQTLTDTASEIAGKDLRKDKSAGKSPITRLSEDIKLAAHLDNEDVASAPNKKEAVKRVKKLLDRELTAVLAGRQRDRASRHTLIHGDSLIELAKLPPSSIDVILTDPPFGVNAHKAMDQSVVQHEYEDTPELAARCYAILAEEGLRIAKPQAHLYCFCEATKFTWFRDCFENAGWYVWKTPLIWWRGTTGIVPRPEHGPRRTYETIIYGIKGDRPTTGIYPDVLAHLEVRGGERLRAAQKPVSLYADLLQRSVRPGDTVLDPFCGSGTIFPAANRLQVIATGIEMSQEAYNTAHLRMEETEE